ncbi:zinc finger protein ZPR1-like [Trichoplusia ni]|uniref:Zinc finger protein ZPR1-like n=1 Tax=Trichoplusia ni TaxID=7111 RepID=A0A7E5WYZ7_TRINI|nr:zinc finger protein ZPR1-like [Trichoplusia ni]
MEQPLFRTLNADDEDPEVTEIESLCIKCFSNGTTRLLLTRIPYYKNVVIMSFCCADCGYQNNEIQPGGAINPKGTIWTLRVQTEDDLNRQVVKSDHTAVTIPELDFEIPATSQKGEVTTVEGILSRAIDGLLQDQESRKQQHPEDATAIDQFVEKLQALRVPGKQWTLVLTDTSGNCFIENPEHPRRDPRCEMTEFSRTKEQDEELGLFTDNQPPPSSQSSALLSPDGAALDYEQLAADDVMRFRTNCPDCDALVYTNMKMTNIPHFKEVIIMATSCDYCGHRTNEVKSGGGVEEKGVRIEVRVAGPQDFSRDLLKSETCSMEIPELELEVGGRALGGRFTTAEGALAATRDQLRACPGLLGDAPGLNPRALREFTEKLDAVLRGEFPVTIILDDPAGNSYAQSLADDPEEPDDGLKITFYERTFEQNEELGLNDMQTENYKTDEHEQHDASDKSEQHEQSDKSDQPDR